MSWIGVIYNGSVQLGGQRHPILMAHHASKIVGLVTDAGHITIMVDGYQPAVAETVVQFDDIRDCMGWLRNEERKHAAQLKAQRKTPGQKRK